MKPKPINRTCRQCGREFITGRQQYEVAGRVFTLAPIKCQHCIDKRFPTTR